MKEDSPSILLLLKLKDYALILGGGVVLPLLVFYLLSRFTRLGGHEWSASVLTYRWIFQLIFLGVLILSLLIQLSRITLRKRLSELGEEEIAVLSLGNAFRIPALALVGFSLACLVAPLEKPAEPLIAAMALILFGMLCWFGVRLFRGLVGGKNGRAYSAALTRSLLPVCSGAVLILALGVLPALQRMEEYWISKDQILDLTGGLSAMEQDASAWLKSEIVAAFSEEGSAE